MFQRKSPRASHIDYTSPGIYFVTICTKDREQHFGKIQNGMMYLNNLGSSCRQSWYQIPTHYPFINLHTFVAMPDHVHLLFTINERIDIKHDVGTKYFSSSYEKGFSSFNENASFHKEVSFHKEDVYNTSLRKIKCPQSDSLGAIVRGFKIGVTKYANEHNIPFARQSSYHDKLVRDKKSYDKICHYIKMNPLNR